MKEIVPMEIIERKILLIRGQKVILDRDLAVLYNVETRALNQAVRRNIDRFPADFIIPLTRKEIMNLSQIVISSGIKHAPSVFAFTEQGVAMLSGLLNSKRAVQVNISIMRAFVRLRELIAGHRELSSRLDALEKKHDKQFKIVFEAIREILSPPAKPKRRIGFTAREKRAEYLNAAR